MPDMPAELEEKPSHVAGTGTDSQTSTCCSSTQSLTLSRPGSSQANLPSSELQELEKNLNGKLKTLLEGMQSHASASREGFATLHEQARIMSEQISEMQRTLAVAYIPGSSLAVESNESHGSDVRHSGRDLNQISSALSAGQSSHYSGRTWRGTQQSMNTVSPQAIGIRHAEAAVEVPRGKPRTRGSDVDAAGTDASHSFFPLHASREHGIASLPCLPIVVELAEEEAADQGHSPPRATTLHNLPSLSGEVEKQHAMSQAADCASCGSDVEGDRPDVRHSSLPLCASKKHGTKTSQCLAALSQLEEEQNADHGRCPPKPIESGDLPSSLGKVERDRNTSHAEALARLRCSIGADASSRNARWATYQALPFTGLQQPSASSLPRQLDIEEGRGSKGGGLVPKKPQPDADSFEGLGHDAPPVSASGKLRPQIFGLRGVLPGGLQGSHGRETRSIGELFFTDMVKQQFGHHDFGGGCCECQVCWFPGSLTVRLQARFQRTGNAVVVFLTYLSGQDSSMSRSCIHKTIVVILAASAPLANRFLSKHSFSPECMSPTKSGFALGFCALLSVLVWAFLRCSQRRSCQESIVHALHRSGLVHDFEAASRWDAFCVVVYWILMVTLKLSLTALEGKRCATDTNLEDAVSTAGFMISAGLLLSVIFAFTKTLRMLELIAKDFPSWVVADDDLPKAVKQWRVCLATIRGVCWAYDYQSLTLFIVLGIIGAFALVDLSHKLSTRALPEAMIAFSILFVSWRATLVTQACRRITTVLSTDSFGKDLPVHRMCMLMDYIDKGKPGFYVLGTRFTPKVVFKVMNAAAVITLAIMSRFSPMFRLS